MRHALIVSIYLFISYLFISCEYVDELHKKGEIIETEVWINEYNVIHIDTPIRLILEQNSEHHAKISGLDFKVASLKFTVENKVLVIESNEHSFGRKDQNVSVQLPVHTLNEIIVNVPTQLSSEGELALENFRLVINGQGTYSESNLKLNCQYVSVSAYGENSGDHILEGKSDNLTITMEGLAWADASSMNVSNVTVNQRSIKNSYVQASTQLIVNMYSSGNVYFTGKPTLIYKTFNPDWEVAFGLAIDNSE